MFGKHACIESERKCKHQRKIQRVVYCALTHAPAHTTTIIDRKTVYECTEFEF